MPGTIIYVDNATVDFSGFKALNGVSFYVDTGELRFLIGPNGAGKTTLLDVICGKVRPTSGQVFFEDQVDIRKLSEHQIARCGISRKFQAPSVFGNLTVMENMELSLTSGRGFFSSLFHKKSAADVDRIDSVLRLVGLVKKADHRAGSLSHGEKQWLELAMTILQDPKLLLVDEPVAGMTGKERIRTGEILLEIAGRTVRAGGRARHGFRQTVCPEGHGAARGKGPLRRIVRPREKRPRGDRRVPGQRRRGGIA